MRESFARTAAALLDEDPRVALLLADISAGLFQDAARRHPGRVVNVGIREQLMIGAAGGMALAGLRPIVHSYATFTVDRVYEQLKLDLGHQGAGAVVVSVGASYDGAEYGYTHFSPADVALLDTLGDWTVHVPGHPDEVAPLLRAAAARDDRTYLRLSTQRHHQPHHDPHHARPAPAGDGLRAVRRGGPTAPLVVAVGPVLDAVLAATGDLDITVAYTHTPRPMDTAGLRALLGDLARVALVEPYLVGASAGAVSAALADLPHRLLSLGVGAGELRRYGTPADHTRWHGLDAPGVRRGLTAWLDR
jgi:transketolase